MRREAGEVSEVEEEVVLTRKVRRHNGRGGWWTDCNHTTMSITRRPLALLTEGKWG